MFKEVFLTAFLVFSISQECFAQGSVGSPIPPILPTETPVPSPTPEPTATAAPIPTVVPSVCPNAMTPTTRAEDGEPVCLWCSQGKGNSCAPNPFCCHYPQNSGDRPLPIGCRINAQSRGVTIDCYNYSIAASGAPKPGLCIYTYSNGAVVECKITYKENKNKSKGICEARDSATYSCKAKTPSGNRRCRSQNHSPRIQMCGRGRTNQSSPGNRPRPNRGIYKLPLAQKAPNL